MEQHLISPAFEVHEIELSYKNPVSIPERLSIHNSSDVAEIFRSFWDMNKIEYLEQFKVMLLNHGGHVLGILEVSSGGLASCPADPKLIFGAALKSAATQIILAHNHPSCIMRPSQIDLGLTEKLCQAGKLLDIKILDHLIISKDQYYSFAEHRQIS